MSEVESESYYRIVKPTKLEIIRANIAKRKAKKRWKK